jgi:LPS-assembly protein
VPDTRLAWLVFAWLIVAATVAVAQERQQLSLGSDTAPVTVFADRVENLERERLLIAEGRVEIEQGDTRLEADRAEVNTETGEAVASGRVVFFDGRDRLTGERFEYNFRTATGIIYRGEGRAEPHFFFKGDRLERFGEKAYHLVEGAFTTCESDPPEWSVRWGRATAHIDDYIWGTNASFWVWKVPLVPFIPVFGANLRKDRQTGFLVPTVGTSSTKGFSYRQPFYWAISDTQDLTVAPTFFEKRGVGLGADYRYVRTEDSRGEASGFGLDDTKLHEWRGIAAWRHEEQITPGLTVKVDLAHVSDITFLSEFGDTLDERSAQRLESNVSLTQRWEKWNFVARLFDYQDLTTPQPIELRRLPELRLNAFQQPAPGLPDLLYQLETSYNNFDREIGSAGQRFDLHPQLAYPWTPAGLFTLTPRVGFRETAYDTKVVGTKLDHGFTVEDTRSDLLSRTLFEGGADLEARAYRIFEMNGAMGVQRLQHVIEPRVSYNYITGNQSTEIPQWDGVDANTEGNSVTYSLTNRLKARAVGDGDQGRVWEMVRLAISQTYSIEPHPATTTAKAIDVNAGTASISTTTASSSRFSNVTGDLILEPLYGIQFRGTANVDPYQSRLASLTTDASYETEYWRASMGTRHGQSGRLQFIQGDLNAKVGSRWLLHVSSNYDVETGTIVENRFEVTFREQCWGFTAAYVNRTTEDEFHITINLLELGSYGFGRAFAAFR